MPQNLPSGGAPAKRRSDLAAVKAWWRTLGSEGCVVLPPPGRSRYTQSDGHEDAAELIGARGLGDGTSFVYWHWQSHTAFDRSGALVRELNLHWGGDHAVVAACLGEGPPGYRVANGGPRGAFGLDRLTERDGEGLPSPDDAAAVRQFLTDVDTPLSRRRLPYAYRPLTGPEAGWLHDRLRAPLDVSAAGPFVTCLERRDALTYEEAAGLLTAWQENYAGRPTSWDGWSALLHALLRHDHPRAWEVVAALGPVAAGVAGEVPSEPGLAVLRDWALAGERVAVGPWLAAYQAVREPDWVSAAGALAREMTECGAPDRSVRALYSALSRAVTTVWLRGSEAGRAAELSFTALLSVRFAVDERLPHRLRVAAAEVAQGRIAELREEAALLGPAYADVTGTGAADALAAADRFEAARAGLLSGTGPDLTAYEGALCDVWPRYRTLTEADTAWLRAQVADGRTAMQGLGFCLELLYSHGAATAAEVDALVPLWKKVLTKRYRTTYTEWRHPLVTLTCLALDLGHPVADELVAWWAKPKPVWKNELRLLTHLGAPDEAKAAELWDFVESRAHDTGHLMTWVLMRARLDGVRPLEVADRLVCGPGRAPYALDRTLIGVADPAQPLWHYSVDLRSRDWWRRAQEVADDVSLSPQARRIGLEAARGHHLIRYPDQVRPAPTKSEVAEALAWVDGHGDTELSPGE